MTFSYSQWAKRSLTDLARATIYGSETWRTTDDRGRTVPLFKYDPPRFSGRDDTSVVPQVDLDWIRQDLQRRGAISGRNTNLLFLGMIAFIIWVNALPLLRSGFTSRNPTDWLGTLIGFVLLASLIRSKSNLGGNPHAIRTVLLLRERCASCRYRLAEIAAQPDGCTNCPECGSAWKLALPDPTPRP